MKIVIISASVRTGKKSDRIALFFEQYIKENKLAEVEILDLHTYQFPIFNERLNFIKNPLPNSVEFAEKVKTADGVLMITPEYNGGYPASLKNIIDYLNDIWKRKVVAISTVSDGIFGGSQVITSLQFSLWKLKAWTVPAMYPVPKVDENYDENGVPTDKEGTEKRAKIFLDEMIWCMTANEKMKEK